MPAEESLAALERQVGNPDERWSALLASVTGTAVQRFAEIERDWLDLMWCLDAYRTAGVSPRQSGRRQDSALSGLGAAYRGKGQWFKTLLTALVSERTSQPLGSRTMVRGFSQSHRLDIAWPARSEDILVCAVARVTGAPADRRHKARGAVDDFVTRRKELKFMAADLKLYRQQDSTAIPRWGEWRQQALPRTYVLWGARLREQGPVRPDSGLEWVEDHVETLITEVQALTRTYLDGAGVYVWKVNGDRSGYVPVDLPSNASVASLDDALAEIAAEINRFASESGGEAPAPVTPSQETVQMELLALDDEYMPLGEG